MGNKQQNRNRYRAEMQQEDRSIHQFRDRMAEFGWLPDRAERDVGEDLTVRIVTNSQPVGVPFYAQLKSVTDLAMRRSKNHLSYRLEVADLLRWEDSSIPVVVFIWDVNLREGRWQTVKSLVQRLDQKNPKWRAKQKITVYLPWENTTDDGGLRLLRTEIGYLLYPIIANDRNVDINFTVAFPNSEEAAAGRIYLDRHIREGTPVFIEGQYVRQLTFSDWWAEWFDDQRSELLGLEIQPQPRPELEPVSVFLSSRNHSTVRFPNIQLRLIRSGTDLLEFSNEHEDKLLTFSFVIPRGLAARTSGTFTFHVNPLECNVAEMLEAIRFLQAVHAGGKLSIIFHRLENTPVSMEFQPTPEDHRFDSTYLNPLYIDLVETLCLIQDKLGHLIQLPTGDIAAADVRAAYELKEILQHGKTVAHSDALSFTVHEVDMIRKLLEYHRNPASGSVLMIRQDADESHIVLFRKKIQVGPMTKTFVGRLDTTVNELEGCIHQNDNEGSYQLKLSNVTTTEEFSNWQRKANDDES